MVHGELVNEAIHQMISRVTYSKVATVRETFHDTPNRYSTDGDHFVLVPMC